MPPSQSSRAAPDEPFDVAVVGGGINGVGIARDAAGRGGRVLLLERGDLASGTSSASTKLIHGGLRYLEHYAFGLVRESLHERETLWSAAPHLIQPMRFVLPVTEGQRPRLVLRAGLFLYDHLGGKKSLPPARAIKLARHPAGAPLRPRADNAFEYSDCWCDDSRLVVANARDAERRGALILTRHEVTEVRRDQGHWAIVAGGRRFAAISLVNAAGPQLSAVNHLVPKSPAIPLRLVRGSHIVLPKLFHHPFAYLFQNADGRVIFAIPFQQEYTLVGTTDVDEDDAARPPRASSEEIDYLIAAANRQFTMQVDRGDVLWTYSGVRPLVDDQNGKPEQASRGYRLDLSPASEGAPLLSVLGGKITTFRHLAERAVDRLGERLPALKTPAWTSSAALPGGNFPKEALALETQALADDYPFLGGPAVERIFKAYGTEARAWLGQARSWRDLGKWFGAGFTEAEAQWMTEQEYAQTSADMLWRRSKLGLHMSEDERLALAQHLGEKAA